MSAYIIVDVKVHDAKLYDEYKGQVPPTLEKHGGRFLVRGGKTESLEGDWSPSRLVVIEFPSAEDARAWWSSPDYAEPKSLRQRASVTQMILADGAD